MRFAWLFLTLFGLAHWLTDVFRPQYLSAEWFAVFAALVIWQIFHSWLLDKIFAKVPRPKIFNMDIRKAENKIVYSMLITEIQQRYKDRLLHEILSFEVDRFNKALKSWGHFDESDYEIFVNISESNDKEIVYIIEAKSERAKQVLMDIAKSVELTTRLF